jgi:hypothetical protein
MTIELTEEQQRVVQEQAGKPVEVLDPVTQRTYVLVESEQYERVRSLLRPLPTLTIPEAPLPEIPPGIRKSQEALRRDLPGLLAQRRLRGQWAAYHGDERIGIARNKTPLLRECQRRGLSDDAYYIGWIDDSELIEEEEIEDPKPEHFEGYDGTYEDIEPPESPSNL